MVQRKLQILKNIAIFVFFVFVGPNIYPRIYEEPVFFMLFGMVAAFALLTIIDFILIAVKVRNRAYFYFNSIIQLPPCFILAGLLGLPGVALLILNIAVIVMLKR